MARYLGTAVMCMILLGQCSCSCPNGTYGFSCGYRCHCEQDKCDSTSGCSSPGCHLGWSGPTCQKHNVARKKATSSSGDGTYPSSLATDGSTNPRKYQDCIETSANNPNWWRVDLNDTLLIREVTIYFRLDYVSRRNGIQVYVTNSTDAPSGQNCYTVTGGSDGSGVANITRAPCSGTGRYILLYTTVNNDKDSLPVLDFCEVEVDVCGHGTFGADCDNYCHCDGDVCNYVSGVCPSGMCMSGWKGNRCNTKCTLNVNYGSGCQGSCSARKCKEGKSPCPQDTGWCDGGCLPGWDGEDCTSECNNTYGHGCGELCSSRHCEGIASSACDHVTGACENGCKAGWKDTDCSQECVDGLEYGVECLKNCSARFCQIGSSTCARDTGQCKDGCKEGWKGVDCTEECQSRTFGVNCSSTCGHCIDNEPCHHVNGTCLVGCSPGWSNDNCQRVKSQSASSSPGNGGAIGGAIGGVVAVAAVVVTVVAVFFYRRNRNANSKTKEHSVYEDVSAFEPHVLELQAPRVNDGYEEEEVESEAGVSNTPDTYYNIGPVIVTEVAVDKLGDRIRDMQATKHGFEKEYQRLISGFTHTYEDSQLEGNTGKNRFLQYYPYDYNRVVLDKLPGDPSSDYVNASYINGFSKKQAYIAAQAPNKKTVADFWRMIYQKNLTKIVMLTNLVEMGKVKCEPYWSDTSDLEAGPFTITVTKIIHRASWVIRELTATLSETGENKMFYQFHFTKWPDHGTPDETALMELLWRVRKTPNPDSSPLLVHCSAGIGRTGTYIAVDYLLDRALRDQKVDVFRFANDMRRQRRNMIQTEEQYACVYTTLHEVLTVGDTFLASLDFIKRRGRKEVFKMGNMAVPTLIQRVKSDIQRAKSGTNMKGRVWVDGRTDILAVVMPSHLSVNGYLLTEAPSVTTASLFWKLTEERESSTVIVLPDSHQSMSCVIPAPGESLDLSPVSVRCSTENTINPDIVLRNIHRQMEGDASSQTVRVYMLRRLPRGDHSVLLDLLEQVDLGTRDNTPNPVTVVFGENEKRVATLFCILSNIVLGMKYDNEVEIYNNIRRLGHLHANDLTQDEISVCYDLASTYLETQNVYANM